MIHWSNPFYRRKWPRAINTFFAQLGRKLTTENGTNYEQPIEHCPSTLNSSNSSSSALNYINGYNSLSLDEEQLYHEIQQSKTNQHTILIPILTHQSTQILVTNTWPSSTSIRSLKENLLTIIFLSLLYFCWFVVIAGLAWIHVVIYLLLLSAYLLSDRTRRFMFAVLIYLAYLLIYDALHLVPNYSISPVHIRDVYLFEKEIFGIYTNQQLMTWNEYFQRNHVPFLDVFTGFCYLNWIPIPIAYSIYLYHYKGKREYMDFALTFLLTNMFGFVIYYIIPTAPPWYIESYGFEFNINAVGDPAGFIHFDQIVGLKIFSSIYSKNANVFAAIPSLHAAYPLITVLYGSLSKKLWLHICFIIFTLSVWFSAVYSRHHYVVDVLAGGSCALTAYLFYRFISRRSPIERLLDAYSKLI